MIIIKNNVFYFYFYFFFCCADHLFVRSHKMGRRIRDRLQRGGPVEF